MKIQISMAQIKILESDSACCLLSSFFWLGSIQNSSGASRQTTEEDDFRNNVRTRGSRVLLIETSAHFQICRIRLGLCFPSIDPSLVQPRLEKKKRRANCAKKNNCRATKNPLVRNRLPLASLE